MLRLCLLVTLLESAAGLAPAAAQVPEASAASAADAPADRLVLVLDSSGSMKEPAAGGGTKIDAAKSALDQVVDRLPDEAQVGVRVFGAEVFSRDDPGAPGRERPTEVPAARRHLRPGVDQRWNVLVGL